MQAALPQEQPIAFSRPGGETCQPSKARPIDLVHLARQTMGDRQVEQEVLVMFAHQLAETRERMARADAGERRAIAHGLKGSSRSVGAFAVADCAAAIEDDPESRQLQKRLSTLVDEVRDFIAAINR